MARVTLQGNGESSANARLRAAVALVMLVGGLGAAMWWRKPDAQTPSSSHLADPDWTPKAPALGSQPAAPIAGAQPWGPLPADVPPQPTMLFEAPPPAMPGLAGPVAPAPAAYPKVSLEWSPEPEAEAAPQPVMKHRVREGETLSSIAQRYLGSRDRYREIYQANRDRLASPDRLIVGMELVIPMSIADNALPLPEPTASRTQPNARQVSNAQRQTGPPTVSNTAGAAPMVPITAGGWRRSSPERTAQRTYAVRKQDTLSGLALQFYGDARRYLELYEANRHQMNSPEDLREGMILVIP